MEKIGIICEYNPFHNGHIYHLQKIKEMYPNSLIILICSGSFTMRGEISLLNKWDKTRIALKYGVDLVIELPCFYATNSADTFAEGAIKILNLLKCDYLVFGSESNDIEMFTKLAREQLNNKEYDTLVKEYMNKGNNYPTSMAKALKSLTGEIISLPNDLLALSYIKEIIKQKSKIIPISIIRTNNYHDKDIKNNITSATSIREALQNNIDIKNTVPKETYNSIITYPIEKNYFSLLKYKILSDIDNLDQYLDVSEGIDNLIKKNILKVNNLNELIARIKTKRYTYNRINRMFIHLLLDIKKEDCPKLKEINYLRILGFSKNGQMFLKKIKKDIQVPIITKYSDSNDTNLQYELYVTTIYNSIINRDDLNQIELKSIPIKKER